jgi:hypothetical protein
MNSLVNYLTGRNEKLSKKNNIIIINEDSIDYEDSESVITINKHNKYTFTNPPYTKNADNEDEESINNEENTDNEDNEYAFTNPPFTYKKMAEICKVYCSGTELLDKWELQRKVDLVLATKLIKMLNKKRKFIFYDPIHIRKKENNSKWELHRKENTTHAKDIFSQKIHKKKRKINKVKNVYLQKINCY